MNIFIIGGSGFVGSRLVSKLLGQHQVTVLTRSAEKGDLLIKKGVEVVFGDLAKMDLVTKKIGKQDLVIYMAMPPIRMGRHTRRHINELSRIIKNYLLNTVNFVRKQKCPVVFTLGTSYRTGENETADETWPIQRYGMTIAGQYFDTLLNELEKEGKVPVIQVLPGQIYGPGGLFLRILKMADQGRYIVLGNGKNRIPRIHVEDLAEGYACIIKKMPVGEKFIFSDDYSCTTLEFNSYLYELMSGKQINPKKIPAFLLRLLLGRYVTDTMMMNCVVSNQKAKKQLEWNITFPTYREGLKATIETYRKGTYRFI